MDPRSALDVTKAVLDRPEVLGRAVVVLEMRCEADPDDRDCRWLPNSVLSASRDGAIRPQRAGGRLGPTARPNPLPLPTRPLQYSLFREITARKENNAMVHKKGQGSVKKNGREVVSKRRGIKALRRASSWTTGSIIVTQCGTRYSAGTVRPASEERQPLRFTDGTVYFDQSGKRVEPDALPTPPTRTSAKGEWPG